MMGHNQWRWLAFSIFLNHLFTNNDNAKGMSDSKRLTVPGGTYFFTVRLQDRHSALLVDQIDLLRNAVALCRKRWPFRIDTAVILPNHLHMIWEMPADDGDYSKRWRLIKSAFSRNLPVSEMDHDTTLAAGAKGVWQRRFWEHLIRDDGDLALHRHLALTSPMRAGLVRSLSDWPYSSMHYRAAKPRAETQRGLGDVLPRPGVSLGSRLKSPPALPLPGRLH